MAVTVTDRRTLLTEADSTTGWNAGTLVTSFFAESTGSIAEAFNIATGQLFFSPAASIDLSNTLVYVYSFNNALQDTWTAADPPNSLYIGDGTNAVSFKMAGADKRVFNHFDGPTEWQCLVLDGSEASAMNTTGLTTVRSGTFASLNLAAITEVGCDFTTLSKALGGGYNVAVDIIRYGNNGLRITNGTSADTGNFQEIVFEDRSTATLKAHGLIRELATGVYGLQGPLTFGDSGVATDSYFEDSGVVLAFENRNIGNDKYYMRVEGNSGANNSFSLNSSTIFTAKPFVTCSFSGGNVDSLSLNGNSFLDLGNDITFSNAPDATNHFVNNNVFNGCGTIFPNSVEFQRNTISNSTKAIAMELGSIGTTKMSDLNFESSGVGHAILITDTGTITFDNFIFSNYGASDTTDAAVYNNSGGAVTINITNGGDTPTIRNGTGASTTVVNAITLSLTNLIEDSEVRIYETGTINEIAGQESVTGGTFQYTYNYTPGTFVDIVIFKETYLFNEPDGRIKNFELPNSNSSIPINQRFDRNYFNP